ncbi:hypothetical protein [Bradyrhizobium australiense]|uniref:Uncharacterized protein n=1 Tax=Bradyrhizobium australiense TaxID=2721161 RepID=A0A7Y4LYT2_9BRAD|nr:hypothetical protein [Bradyrhizobium australiense]NOJ43591.1 hypothetical protein [Bradyrhizobium australiense]
MGVSMMRFWSNLYLTPALSGLIMVALLVLGAIIVQSVGPAENGGGVITASERSDVRTRTTPESGGRVTLDIGVADLRGSLP